MNSYVIETTDSYLLQITEKKIIKDNNFEDSEYSIYDLEEETLENALEDLDTYNFLSTKKTIIIRNIDILKYDENKKDLEHLFKYIQNPENDKLLIIEVKKLDNKTKIAKELKGKCKIIIPEVNSKTYIKNELKDYKVSQDTINLLDEYCSNDFNKIKNECNKLKNYKYLEKEINKSDIEDIVVKKEIDSKETVFQFTRAIAERNIKKSLQLYKELVAQNNDAIGILGLLGSQFRIIYQVIILEDKNMSDKEIAKTLDEKEFRIKKTRELTRLYTKDEVLKLIIKLADIDYKIKTTDIDGNTQIELFILNINENNA